MSSQLKRGDRVVVVEHDRVGVVQDVGSTLKVAIEVPSGRSVTLDLDRNEVIVLEEALNG